ncbi:MFS transporter [Chitinophaga rhizophila]|uniref:MFS transporter n=1 Tax=Chitinophaga rhizophila TaxID=2866212 RepID=A0ABS7GA42_9BACT|nr:MFS transporter [Chitinophaga rhizophila]MBW8684165.1 MFS transporter [Chitinophaga rhizophila]
MANRHTIFKPWASEWLIRAVIFLNLLPSMLMFGISTASGPNAAGYYGIEPADVQYSMVLFYASLAGFFALERRFFDFIASKEYLVIGVILQIVTSYFCYVTRDLYVLLPLRFIQGMANCVTTSVCITLVFSRLKTNRSREIGYSLFYGVLLCITAFTTLVTAPIIDAFDFNVLYKWMIFIYVPGAVLLVIIMNRIRLTKKFPLYQLDWASYVVYTTMLCLMGYILLYGQQYDWLNDPRIQAASIAVVLLLIIHVLRQRSLKRPYLSLEVFRYRNYVIGVSLIVVLYVCRGAFNITTNYFTTVLGMDPRHLSYILLMNIAGIIVGVLYSSRWILLKRSMRWIWIAGFSLLLIFHLWMHVLFATQADTPTFIVPLILQGIGVGLLMAPMIIYAISSVPPHLGGTASATGVLFRFAGFCISIALINYFQLFSRKVHYNRFLDLVTSLDPLATAKLVHYKTAVAAKGIPADQASKIANGLLYRTADIQSQIRFSMDYYYMISCVLAAIILLIAFAPYLNRTVVNLRNNQPAPAAY